MRLTRRTFGLGVGMIVVNGLLAGCIESTSDDADEIAADETSAESSDDADAEEAFQDIESFEVSELNLQTLTAETPDETLEAQAWANTWVGEVTDDLFIGIRIQNPEGDRPREVTAYLCDDDFWKILEGEMDEDQAALSDDGTEVEFTLVEDEISGTVSLSADEPIQFSAHPASDDAGVYIAGTEIEDVEVTARWIVQEDGRQRGVAICCEWPPTGTGPPICRHCKQLN